MLPQFVTPMSSALHTELPFTVLPAQKSTRGQIPTTQIPTPQLHSHFLAYQPTSTTPMDANQILMNASFLAEQSIKALSQTESIGRGELVAMSPIMTTNPMLEIVMEATNQNGIANGLGDAHHTNMAGEELV